MLKNTAGFFVFKAHWEVSDKNDLIFQKLFTFDFPSDSELSCNFRTLQLSV